jgi:uncharacterized membrane protein
VRTFLLAFALTFFLRLSALLAAPGLPFWFDEAWTAQFATFPSAPATVARRVAAEDLHPPLGYLAYKAWAGLLGIRDRIEAPPPPGHEDRLRLLPLLAGSLGAGFLALAALRLGASEAGALAAAFLSAASPAALSVGLEVRQYGLLLLLFPLLLYAFAAEKKRLFALTGAAALYTHYAALLFLLPFALHRAFRRPTLLALILFLPWVPALLRQLTSPLMGEAREYTTPPAELLPPSLANLGGDPLLGLLLLALAGLGLRRAGLSLPAVGFFLGLLALFVLKSPGGNPRYAVLLAPYLALGLAFALEALRHRVRGLPPAVLLLLPAALLPLSFPQAIKHRGEVASQAKAAVFAAGFPLEPVYAYDWSAAYTFRYYERRKAVEPVTPSPPRRPGLLIAPAPSVLSKVRGLPPWLLEAEPVYVPGGWAVYLWRGGGQGGR